MKYVSYDESQARALVPLLESIGREVVERQGTVRALVQIAALGIQASEELAWELALHRRELERAQRELELLGCSLVGRRPLTIRIRRASGSGPSSFLWQGAELLAY